MKEKNIKNINKISLWLPPIVWAGVIFLFSSFPTTTTTTFYLGDFLLKKSAHVIEYGIFATLVYRALINSNITKNKSMWMSVLIAFLYGLTDEFHQSFTPGRGPKFTDVLIDTSGATLFVYGIVNNAKKMPKVVNQLLSRFKLDI